MPRYVGEIRTSGFYVNFYPTYIYEKDKFIRLSDEDVEKILPGSQYPNLNLFSSSTSMRLDDLFQDGDDVIIDFQSDKLIPNLKSDGSVYPSAWKLDVFKQYSGSILRMEEVGWYYALPQEAVEGDWRKDSTVILNTRDVNEDMRVMIPGPIENTLVGPFRVRYDEDLDELVIYPSLDQKNSIISGYLYSPSLADRIHTLEQIDVTRGYVRIEGEGVEPCPTDTISDEELIENFTASIKGKTAKTIGVDPAAFASLLASYQNSLISGKDIPAALAAERVKRLQAIFESSAKIGELFNELSSLIPEMFKARKDDPDYMDMVHELLENEEFVEALPAYSEYVTFTSQLKQKNSELKAQKEELQKAVDELEILQPKQQLERYQEELDQLKSMKAKAEEEFQEALRQANIGKDVANLEARSSYLQEEIARREKSIADLNVQMEGLQGKLDELLERSSQKTLEISFDDMISERFMEHTARLENARRLEIYQQASRAIAAMPRSFLSKEQLVDYLVFTMQKSRPEYSRNEILNILICLTQGFLTIFTGQPGSGKTSICRVTAQALHLDQPAELEKSHPQFPYCSRFVSISVERGWSSRRDLIGFYNSLTRSFEKADPRLFDLLSILNQESRGNSGSDSLPALVLLDDANLSSMEYYWADFMSMEENAAIRGTIALGDTYTFEIPRTLHFAAAIQSDHTTEPLSSRLLDRAWVITMPEKRLLLKPARPLMEDEFRSSLITHEQLDEVFLPQEDSQTLPSALEDVYQSLAALFKEAGLTVSIRSESALRKYVLTALRWFVPDEDEAYSDAGTMALDYAVLQRLLPKINGSSHQFRTILEKMKKVCETGGLIKCGRKLKEIMEKGDGSMQFYQFFS